MLQTEPSRLSSPKANCIRILSIPHIIRSVSDGLCNNDLLQCMLVNKTWHNLFSLELYSNRTIHDCLYTEEYRHAFIPWDPFTSYGHHVHALQPRTKRNNMPPCPIPENFFKAVIRYKQDIRSVSSGRGPLFIRGLDMLQVADLAHLSIQFRDVDQHMENLVYRNRRTLRHLEIKYVDVSEGFATIPSIKTFYSRVSDLDQLSHLQLSFAGRGPELDCWLSLVLASLPPSVQDLELAALEGRRPSSIFGRTVMEDYKSPGLNSMSLRALSHRYLKSVKLILNLDTMTNECAGRLEALLRSPALSSLAINFGSEEVLLKVSQVLSSGVSLQLRTFSAKTRSIGSRINDHLAACFDAMAAGPLKELMMPEFWGGLIPPLSRHMPYLESLTLHHTLHMAEKPMSIFQNCPRLRHLSLSSKEEPKYTVWNLISEEEPRYTVWNSWDMWELQSWPCSQNLTHLSLLACCTNTRGMPEKNAPWDPEPDLLARYPKTSKHALHMYIHLAQLTHLEYLKIGVVHMESFQEYAERYRYGFEFSLRSGLALLAPLKRMRCLAFFKRRSKCHWQLNDMLDVITCPMEPQIGPEEAEWMVQHWPFLNEIQLDIQEAEKDIQEVQKKRAVADQWEEALTEVTEACTLLTRARDASQSAMELSKLANSADETEDTAPPVCSRAALRAAEKLQRRFRLKYQLASKKAQVAVNGYLSKWRSANVLLGPLSNWVALRAQLSNRVKVRFWPEEEGEFNRNEFGQQPK